MTNIQDGPPEYGSCLGAGVTGEVAQVASKIRPTNMPARDHA